MRKLRAAIIGLGKIGIDFDRLEKRSTNGDIWTHYSAYHALSEKYQLVCAVETSVEKIKAVHKYDPALVIYPSISDLAAQNIDVVSICTPDQFHLVNLKECLSICSAIFIEKPLFADVSKEEIAQLSNVIQTKKKIVYVNYYKRDEPAILKLKEYVKHEKIHAIICKYSGPLEAVGSHAIDLINNISSIITLLSVDGDKSAASAQFRCQNGAKAFLIHTGERYHLIFELEVITSNGRFVVSENLSRFKQEVFVPSDRYNGYSELGVKKEVLYSKNPNRLVKYLENIYMNTVQQTYDLENYFSSVSSQEWLDEIKKRSVVDEK